MLLNIGGFDVEIKAKKNFHDRFNKNDSIEFLDYLQHAFLNAADHAKNTPVENIFEKDFRKDSYMLFKVCDDTGYYDKLIEDLL